MISRDFPLLHDHHTHPLLYAAFRSGIDLSETNSMQEASDLICGATGPLAIAHGWKSNRFAIQEADIEKLPPVAIFNVSLHELKVNASAAELLQQKFGNSVKQIGNQNWFEQNLRLVLNWFALMGGSPESLVEFYQWLESVGLDSAEEMLLVDEIEIDWFQQAGLTGKTKFWAAPDTMKTLSQTARSKVHGLKLFTDGAFGAHSAAISKPYLGQTDNTGMLIYSDDNLCSTLVECSHLGNAIAVHAIGDKAIEQTIRCIDATGISNRIDEIRIEHAQLISRQQANCAKDLGIKLSMQPNFNSDSIHYADRLSESLLQANNPFRMLIDEVGYEPGVDLILGSDGMPHGVQHAWKEVNDPPFESQRLTQAEFVAGYGG